MKLRSGMKDVMGMLGVFIILFVVMALFVDNFSTPLNLKNLLLMVSTVGMLSCTMLLCLAGGDFDLSIGSTIALSSVMSALIINGTGNVALALLAPMLTGAFIGLVNGFVIAKLGINALITTLSTMQIVRGAAYLICNGSSVGTSSKEFTTLGNSTWLGLKSPVWITAALVALFAFILNKTTFGRNVMAIGGNAEAARLSGINIVKTKMMVFMMQGLVAALAGVVIASRVTSGQPREAEGMELQVISACVLGGVSLTGGVGTMTGVVVGVLIMGMIKNALQLRNVEQFYQLVIMGAVLLAAVIFDRWRSARAARV